MFRKLLILGMLVTSLFGNVRELTDENFDKAIKRGMVVVEYYAGWNKANIVTLLDEWDNFEVNRVCRLDVEKYDKIMTSNNVELLIHGHTHRLKVHSLEINEIPAKRIVLGDWDKSAWYIWMDNKSCELKKFPIA
mgnify:CR=1 FL=1